MSNTVIVAYVPVLHQGYLNFFAKHPEAKVLFLIDRAVLTELVPSLEKDIRALSAEEMKKALEGLGKLGALPAMAGAPGCEVVVLSNPSELEGFDELIIPDDEAMHAYAEKFLAGKNITWDSIFLRWDSQRSLAKKSVEVDVEVSQSEIDQKFMNMTAKLAEKSSDWWRQLGAIVVKDNQVLLESYNHHVPNEQQPYYDGDPRANFHKGEHIELSTAIHAEQSLIAEAAKKGISLQGCDLYVTTFPCPVCSKLIAYSGIKRVFFRDGYSMVDGEALMKENGVEIVRVVK